jgi:membrane protein YqaA with SNARE-associated domain
VSELHKLEYQTPELKIRRGFRNRWWFWLLLLMLVPMVIIELLTLFIGMMGYRG